MPTKKYRPNTPGYRTRQTEDFSILTTNVPDKSLVVPHHQNKGRNNQGKITSRRMGGGVKRKYRVCQ